MSNGLTNVFLATLSLIFLVSCRGLDDNSEFNPSTRTSLFLAVNQSNGNPEVVEISRDSVVGDWVQTLGLNGFMISDFEMRDQFAWISSAGQGLVLKYDLREKEFTEAFQFETLHPHFIAPGHKMLLASDTSANKIGFIDIKKDKKVVLDMDSAPGKAIYNAGKFYLKKGCCTVSLYNELALTETAEFILQDTIIEIQLDRNFDAYILGKNGPDHGLSVIDANSDLLLSNSSPVAYRQIRYTPWYGKIYGTEYTNNIQLSVNQLNTSPKLFPVDHFEVDFFESKIYYQLDDTLTIFDLHNKIELSRVYFPYTVIRAFHYLDSE